MALLVTCDDHHFASSEETTHFRVTPPEGKKIQELTLEVTDAAGTLVYMADWAVGTIPADGKYQWDGEINQPPTDASPAPGPDRAPAPATDSVGAEDDEGLPAPAPAPSPAAPATKRYVSPLGSPFTSRFRAKVAPAAPLAQPPQGISSQSDGEKVSCPQEGKPVPPDSDEENQEGSGIVWVLYRGLKFEQIAWLEVFKAVSTLADGSFPTAGTLDQKKMWLAYILNELGYIAGPIDDPPAPQPILRALFRYTQSHPDLAKIVHFTTLDTPGTPAPGNGHWGWRALWEARFGALDEICTGGIKVDGDDLLNRLKAGEHPRADLIETPAAILDRTAATRIILDHDIYYINKDYPTANANTDYDAEFLNRFCLPFRARASLVSQTDLDATRAGIPASKGVGAFTCHWSAFDPPDDLAKIPPPLMVDYPIKSRARQYVDATHKSIAGRYRDPLHALDNCPAGLGGVRPADGSRMAQYFRAVRNPHVFAGCATRIFEGSYIGGDNYIVQAAISLDGAINAEQLKREHQSLAGLAGAFESPAPMAPDGREIPLATQSGAMTLWRRHHVLREVVWDSSAPAAIVWPPIVGNFKAAHVILVPPVLPQVQIDNLLSTPTMQAIANAMVADPQAAAANATKAEFDRRRAEARFDAGAMYPLPLLTLTAWETAYPGSRDQTGDPASRLKEYTRYLIGQHAGWPGYVTFLEPARRIREALDALHAGPGLVLLRVRHMPLPDFRALLPRDVFDATAAERAAFTYVRRIAVGMDYGIIFLDDVNYSMITEAYFTTHEIAHCLFLDHPFEAPSIPHHESADMNCLMYYNEPGGKGNAGVWHGWGVKVAPATHVQRLLIEYDREQGTLCGSFSEDLEASGRTKDTLFMPDVEWGVFLVSGTVDHIRGVLSRLKFTPAKFLDPDREVRLCMYTPVEMPQIPPKYSVLLPHVVSTTKRRKTIKPFAHVKVNPVEIGVGEPRFCGKCVLKLRGWRVFHGAPPPVGAPAVVIPERSRAVPVRGRMKFTGYSVGQGDVRFLVDGGEPMVVAFGLDAKDPANRRPPLGPFYFAHVHLYSWQSSTGNLQDLSDLGVREHIQWRFPTQARPFNEYADPEQWFTQAAGTGADGGGPDKHSIGLPAFICARDANGTPVPGTIIAEQRYQYCLIPGYSTNPADWVDMPDSHFLLEKSVYYDGKQWVMCFKKSNLPPQNTVPYFFEIHYKIGPRPSIAPPLMRNEFAGATPGAPKLRRNGVGIITNEVWAAGDNTTGVFFNSTNAVETTLEILKKKGYAIRGTPTP